MLTATYTLVALSVEQASVRVSLQSFQKYLQANFRYQSVLTSGQVEFACKAVQRLFDSCHWYKIEHFLLPAIGSASQDAGRLVLELENLNRAASDLIGVVGQSREAAALDSEAKVAHFCRVIEDFCSTMLRRLELEEKALFPLARSVISGEAWFSIANRMLAHDWQKKERRSSGRLGPGRLPATPAGDQGGQTDLFPASLA
jgi:hemerythrin-like domain-containing protein